MRRQIFMYLFLFAVLYIVFQYMNAKKAYVEMDHLKVQVETLKKENNTLEAQIDSLQQVTQYLNYFSLQDNDAASSVYSQKGFDVDSLAAEIKSEIIGRNKANADNELVPFDGLVGIMRVNHIKILNHRWVLADFTDGVYWGEVLLKYTIDENGNLTFSTIESFLYPERR